MQSTCRREGQQRLTGLESRRGQAQRPNTLASGMHTQQMHRPLPDIGLLAVGIWCRAQMRLCLRRPARRLSRQCQAICKEPGKRSAAAVHTEVGSSSGSIPPDRSPHVLLQLLHALLSRVDDS